ncbi:hypothetical protein JCGZ_23622 [Jatropha curcas]|uniref:Uncharacterized protein n=1 Tax=Jatropha curcas TaxID=180498 RepID=A0A067L2N2_JATCU|nr:hypothetical protein JCGZ_23622 [Jatropha curcas]
MSHESLRPAPSQLALEPLLDCSPIQSIASEDAVSQQNALSSPSPIIATSRSQIAAALDEHTIVVGKVRNGVVEAKMVSDNMEVFTLGI